MDYYRGKMDYLELAQDADAGAMFVLSQPGFSEKEPRRAMPFTLHGLRMLHALVGDAIEAFDKRQPEGQS
jgi:hypothetical protein